MLPLIWGFAIPLVAATPQVEERRADGYGATRLVFEFPASGGIVPSSAFRTVRLYRYAVADTPFALAAVVAYVVYFTAEELFEIAYFRLRYFSAFWNVVDLGIVVLGWFCFWIAALAVHDQPRPKDTAIAEDRRSYERLAVRRETLEQLTAFATFLVFVKIIKYIDLNRPMTVMYLSVGRCFKIVASYVVVMAIIVAAFAVLGYYAFGTHVKEFSTVHDSLRSALGIMIWDFDFRALEHADQTFAAFFFVLFTCAVIFVLLTMLVAVVFHAYFDVHVEELLTDRKPYVCDKVSAFVDDALLRMGFRKWSLRRRDDRIKAELDSRIAYQDVYKTLKRCRFTDLEVENVLKKHGIQPENTVSEDQAREVFRDALYDGTGSGKKENEKPATSDTSDVQWLIERVNLLENSLDEVHKKCDIVISRLDAIRVHLPPNYAEQSTAQRDNS